MMALLAGPTAIQAYEPGDWDVIAGASDYFWDDSVGLSVIGAYTRTGDTFGFGPNYFIVQLDGTVGSRGKASPGSVLIDTTGQYQHAFYRADFDLALGVGAGTVWGFDARTAIFQDQLIAHSAGIFRNTGGVAVRALDRLIAIRGSDVIKAAIDGSDGGFVSEAALSGPGGSSKVSRTNKPNVVCIIYDSGDVLFYDVAAKAEVIPAWRPHIGSNVAAWYSVRFDIYIALVDVSGVKSISVYANEVAPATLSNPVGTLTKGRVSTVRSRLLGSNSEPCAGELIAWSMTGDGALTATQSKTDADGYASVGYIAPFAVTTAPTIEAEAVF
jgi:hypothetical protein